MCGSNHTDQALAGGARQQAAIGQVEAQGKSRAGEAGQGAEDVRRGGVGRGGRELATRPCVVVMAPMMPGTESGGLGVARKTSSGGRC